MGSRVDGYGRVNREGKSVGAHRAVYEELVAPVPSGLHLDHLCRNRCCVNPAHLDPVTPRENTARSTAWEETRKRHAAKTHCPKGHSYDAENTRFYVKQGYICRACRSCLRERSRAKAESRWKGLWRKGQEICVNGHVMDEANTRLRPSGGRSCRACERERSRRNYYANLDENRAKARERMREAFRVRKERG